MATRDVPDPLSAPTAELGGEAPRLPVDDSLADLSAPPGSEDGSLAALLNVVAAAPSALPPIELAPGDELGGVYRIVRKLGAGGMGVVYLARDLELQRDVALKVHRASSGTERLYREAVAMAQLSHPNVVTIHGVGRVRGQLYIAMEFVQGDNLSTWMAAAPRSWREVLDLMLAVGDGLVAAHDAGFVHRDIKPHNILVGQDGRPRLGDFGLVRVTGESGRIDVLDDDDLDAAGDGETDGAAPVSAGSGPGKTPSGPGKTPSGSGRATTSSASGRSPASSPSGSSPLALDLTAFGTTLGTPAYMAPEQLAGHPVDARADQFAFCVVLYEALYGQRPWPGRTVDELRDQLARLEPGEPPRRGVPARVWTALRRGLAREPSARHPDVRALLATLRLSSQRGRRLALAAGSAALLASAAGAVLLARSAGGGGPATCDEAGTPALAAWGPGARHRIGARYVRLDPQAGPDATAALAGALDGWSQRWQRAAVQVCHASGPRTSWSPAVRAASASCLKESLAAVRALVARAETSPTLLSDASSVPDPERCADPVRLAAVAPAAQIEGHWKGDFGHLLLRRVGDELWGVYEHDGGTVRGVVDGDRFVGWWCEAPSRAPPGDAGDVEMKVIVDQAGVRAIAGQWRYGDSGDWDDRWDLTADPSPPPPGLVARLDATATFCRRPAPR